VQVSVKCIVDCKEVAFSVSTGLIIVIIRIMTAYETDIKNQLQKWENKMQSRPSMMDKLAKKIQTKINSYIPEKVHGGITTAIKQMIRVVLFGAKFTTKSAVPDMSIEEREDAAEEKIGFYQKTAAAEGGLTGAGGILLGLADFPLLLGIKLKLLFELAAVYGYDVKDYKERLYILYIFQLAFCSRQQQHIVYKQIANWQETVKQLPEDIHQLDWRTLQQEYRDYIDIAKMAQLVPVIGAPVGAVVNYRLIRKLGDTAKNAYRLRYFASLQMATTGTDKLP
jgi:hypothetical protein